MTLNQKEDLVVPLEAHPFFSSILNVMIMMILITSYLLDLYKWANLLFKCSLTDPVQLASSLQYLDLLQLFFSKAKGWGHSVCDIAVLGPGEELSGEMNWFFLIR